MGLYISPSLCPCALEHDHWGTCPGGIKVGGKPWGRSYKVSLEFHYLPVPAALLLYIQYLEYFLSKNGRVYSLQLIYFVSLIGSASCAQCMTLCSLILCSSDIYYVRVASLD